MTLEQPLADADVKCVCDLLYHQLAQVLVVFVQGLPHLLQSLFLLVDFLQHLDLSFVE